MTKQPYTLDDVEEMRIGEQVPAFNVRLLPEEAERLKVLAEKRGKLRKYLHPGPELERAYLCYHALRHLAHDSSGLQQPVIKGVMRLSSGVSLSTPRSLRHRDLVRFHTMGIELWAAWPVTNRIGDLVVAGSVRTNRDGSSSVGVWGVMAGDLVREAVATGHRYPPRAKGSHYVRLMLREFDAGLLKRLLRGEEE